MTWIKNSVKLLILGLAVVSVATTQETQAIAISDTPSFSIHSFGDYNGTLNYRYDMNYISRYGDGSKKNVSITYSSNASPISSWLGTSPYMTQTYSLYVQKNSGYLTVKSYDINFNLLEESIPFAGVSETFGNETVQLTNIWFGNNTYILYDDNLTHTLQYIGNYKIKDYIIFIDPLTETLESATYDNFYLISIPQRKAWSLKMLITHLDNLYYGNLSNYDIKTFPYTSSYTLTALTGTTIFPKYTSYMSSSKSYVPGDIGFLYNKDSEYIAPDFGGSTDGSSQSNFNIDLVNQYNDCVNKGENLRKALQLSSMCKLQGEDSWENIIINTGLNYTGSYSYCSDLDTFISTVYNIYSGNWNTGIINENTNLQDNSAPFNDLLFSWYYNSVFIDSGHNISGLPNGNTWCTAYTVSNFYDSEKSTIEKISESIADFFGNDIADIYNNSVGSHSTFSGLITSLSAGTSGFFNGYLFEPYQQQFNSGYNAFHTDLGINSCEDINSVFSNTPLGNAVLYIISALLIFILLFLH